MIVVLVALLASQDPSLDPVGFEADLESVDDDDDDDVDVRPRALSPQVQGCLDLADLDLDGGRRCLQDLVDGGAVDGVDRADAQAALLVLQRLQRHLAPTRPAPVREPPAATDRAARFALDGHLEAGIHGAAWGGLAGFLGTAGVLAATRTSERDAFPLLLTAPALGVVAGALAGIGAVELSGASADDVAFAASTTWAGTALGFTLQLAVFAGENDVHAAPMRFFTTLAGGVLGLTAGAGWGPFLDVSAADASLANSGFFWGGVLTATTLGMVATFGQPTDFATALMIVGGGCVLPWGAVLALHPLFQLHRVSTWLVDVGGVLGVIGGAAGAFIVATAVGDGRVFLPVFGAAVVGGLGLGIAGAVVVDDATRDAFPPPAPLAFGPAFFQTHDGGLAPGVTVRLARW